jgi:hypothetical protein
VPSTDQQHDKGEIILDIDQPTNGLSTIVSEQAQEVSDCDQGLCEKGTYLADATFFVAEMLLAL